MMKVIIALVALTGALSAAASHLSFFEIVVGNRQKAERFYSQALGWKFRDVGSKEFIFITNAGTEGGLLATSTKVERGASVKLFFQSADLTQSLAKVKKAGGTVILEPMSLGDGRWIAEFKDPDGNSIGLMSKKR